MVSTSDKVSPLSKCESRKLRKQQKKAGIEVPTTQAIKQDHYLPDISALALYSVPKTQPSTPKKPAAAKKVFGTPELLDRILEDVPSSQLLELKRVSHSFYRSIDGSAPLNKSLGLRISGDLTLEYRGKDQQEQCKGNEALFKSKYTIVSNDDFFLVSKKLPGLPCFRFTACNYRCGSLTFRIGSREAMEIVESYDAGIRYDDVVCEPPLPLGIVIKFQVHPGIRSQYLYGGRSWDSDRYDILAGKKVLSMGGFDLEKVQEELVKFCRDYGSDLV